MDNKNKAAFITRELCFITGKLATKYCPRVFKRRIPENSKLAACVYHNIRQDPDNLYIHHVMNTKYKRNNRYEYARAVREDEFISRVLGDVDKLKKLLKKLDNSHRIKHVIRVVDPKPKDIRDHYGNYEEILPNLKTSTAIDHDLRWMYLNGTKLSGKLRRELSRKYHVPSNIIQFSYDSIREDLGKYDSETLELLRQVEKRHRRIGASLKRRKDSKAVKK